jgi:hypothetical protein
LALRQVLRQPFDKLRVKLRAGLRVKLRGRFSSWFQALFTLFSRMARALRMVSKLGEDAINISPMAL